MRHVLARGLAPDRTPFVDGFPWSDYAPPEAQKQDPGPDPGPAASATLEEAWIEPLCISDALVSVAASPPPTPTPIPWPAGSPPPPKTPTARPPASPTTTPNRVTSQSAVARTPTAAPKPPAPAPKPAAAAAKTDAAIAKPVQVVNVKPVAHINNANITFYDCKVQGFCEEMYNGRKVYEGAAACSFDLALGTKFRILGDPTERVYNCDDRGYLSKTWVDIFFHDPADGWSWQSRVGRCGTVEIVVPR